MKYFNTSITAIVILMLHNPLSLAGQSKKETFESFVKKYETSINEADTIIGANLWLKSSDISFIHPRGTEYGWKGIKNIYAMFSSSFSKRKLHASNIKFVVYDSVAWLTFEWVFDATMRQENKVIQTKGRETQILKKVKNDWKLVHIHYSGMPVTEQGQGF